MEINIWEILQWVGIGVGAILTVVAIFKFFQTVRPTNRGLIERFGKYQRFANPGLNLVIPFVENLIKVNITEMMVNAEKQEIITKDKLNASVDAQIYFKIKSDEKSVKDAIYNVNNINLQIVALARTTLRGIIGKMNLSEANSDRDKINQELLLTLAKETANWGIDIVRAELKEIDPPENVQQAMNQVVMAENQKVAAIDFATATETKADGERRARIKEAEGQSQAQILQATGFKEATILKAQGEAEAIKVVNEAANTYFKGNAVILKQLEVTQTSLKDNAKIILTKDGITPSLLIGNLGAVQDLKG